VGVAATYDDALTSAPPSATTPPRPPPTDYPHARTPTRPKHTRRVLRRLAAAHPRPWLHTASNSTKLWLAATCPDNHPGSDQFRTNEASKSVVRGVCTRHFSTGCFRHMQSYVVSTFACYGSTRTDGRGTAIIKLEAVPLAPRMLTRAKRASVRSQR